MNYEGLMLAREVYEERVRQAEIARRFRMVKSPGAEVGTRIRNLIGSVLIDSGKRLKGPVSVSAAGA